MGIKFPSALFGMFCIFSILVVLDLSFPVAAIFLRNFFEPALLFIQRWLPLFYVPALVVLPISIQDIPAASGLKICFIIGMIMNVWYWHVVQYCSSSYWLWFVKHLCWNEKKNWIFIDAREMIWKIVLSWGFLFRHKFWSVVYLISKTRHGSCRKNKGLLGF